MLGANLLIILWLMLLQVLIPCYENFIYAQFATPVKPRPIDSGEDLLKAVSKGGMAWEAYQGSIYYKMFKFAPEGSVMSKLYHQSPPTWRVLSVLECLNKILNENYAFIFSEIRGKLRRLENTQYHVSTSGFCLILASLAMRINSPHKRLVNFYIQYARDYGLISKWEKDVELEIKRDLIPMEENMALNLQLMRYLFYILSIGLVLSGIVFAIELLTAKKFKMKGHKPKDVSKNFFTYVSYLSVREQVLHPIVKVSLSDISTLKNS